MRLIFMGSPDFAVPSLQALLDSAHEIIAVYTQPPRRKGRGQQVQPTPIHALAEQHNIPVFTPAKLAGDALNDLLALEFDAIAVVAYGLLLPKALVENHLCLNVHPSALPRWRGAAPLQWTVLSGDATTDVCIMQLETGMDTGPVFTRQTYEVGPNETTGQLHDRLAQSGAELLLQTVARLPATPTPQAADGITHAPKITAEMRPINWHMDAEEVHNHIRGMAPFPGATTQRGEEVWKILASHLVPMEVDSPQAPGTIMQANADGIVVHCGTGCVRLTKLQRPGKQALAAAEFLRSTPLAAGDTFTCAA